MTPWAWLGAVARVALSPFGRLRRERIAVVTFSAYVLLFLWGRHGELGLLTIVDAGWCGLRNPCDHARSVWILGLPWDQELLSFALGFILLVLIPCVVIRVGFREPLTRYGLGLPRRTRGAFAAWSTLVLSALVVPSMALATHNAEMRAVYPFFRDFRSMADFVTYEIAYVLFFITIEFVFRGYLLFGLCDPMPGEAEPVNRGTLSRANALFTSALAYTIWHHGKPLPEQVGTLIWGVAAGALALEIGSLWPIIAVHWGMNVLFDALVWGGA